MGMQTKKRIMALLVLSVFLLSAFFSASPIIEHADHDCTGYDCTICIQLHTAQHLLKQIVAAILGAGFLYAGLCFARLLFQHAVAGAALLTPVSLKVRMDN